MAEIESQVPQNEDKLQAGARARRERAKSRAEPARAQDTLPRTSVVGIGASAGGLMALRAFFRALPDVTGLSFVVVVHLSPEHESVLADLLQPHTPMPVQQVSGRVKMQPDHVYVIPPAKRLVVTEGHLDLEEFGIPRGPRLQIDTFFRSLAEHHGDGAAIILSGSGSDGAVGIQSIKEEGGLILVQDPAEAEYDGMPKSAIATGLVDVVAPVAELAAQLVSAKRTGATLDLPVEPENLSAAAEESLVQILAQLRVRSGHDLSGYKRSTILRRIARRMQLAQVSTLSAYLQRLRRDGDETDALFRDVLIHVTEFFRDQTAWQSLTHDVIPQVFKDRGRNDTVRAWSVGCATGEEAYSLAIVLLEHVEEFGHSPQIQIFASDLGVLALDFARQGIYPQAIAANISPERLARYFSEENSHFRVRDELRERVLFAPHDLLQDPPFSKLDLVVCRNLLIYLQREMQERVLETFYYALRPDGYLFLGSAESPDGISERFETVNKGHRIYRPNQQYRSHLVVPVLPLQPHVPRGLKLQASDYARTSSAGRDHLRSLESVGPPSALVDATYQVLHLSEMAGRYLQAPGGPPTTDVVRLVRPELQADLRAALFRAIEVRRTTLTRPVPVQFNGDSHRVSLLVRPVRTDSGAERALVVFLEDETPLTKVSAGDDENVQVVSSRHIQAELGEAQRRLQAMREEYESTVEELRAANEELQSTNEEYRSTLEELETSKEELQSINEELQTVNQELRIKVEETVQAHNDLQNLFAATEIATLFLDRELRIKRYTPAAGEIFNLMPPDRGRPIGHLRGTLRYEELAADAGRVLLNLVTIEREVQTDGSSEGGRWYKVSVRPYRTSQDRIDGVVITFVDISTNKANELAVRQTNEHLEELVHERTRQVRALVTQLTRSEQAERRRISEVLHDDLQQRLYAARYQLMLLRSALDDGEDDRALHEIAAVEEIVDTVVGITRSLSLDLSPPVLHNEGLAEAVRWLAHQMEEQHGLAVDVHTTDDMPLPNADLRVLLFQVVREMLFNMVKHAGVSQATIALSRTDHGIHVEVNDRGKGFDAAVILKDATRSHGLDQNRRRLELVGGTLQIKSAVGSGTQIVIECPVDGETW